MVAVLATPKQPLQAELSPKQALFFTRNEKVIAYIGGIGSGKTHVGSKWAGGTALENPGSIGFIGANTADQLHKSTLPPLFATLDAWGINYVYNRVPSWYDSYFKRCEGVISLENGSQIICRTLQNYNFIRGIQISWFWIDEARDTPEEAFDVIMGRMRHPIGPRKGRITSSPAGYNWLHEVFVERQIPDYLSVSTSIYENAANLPDGYILSLEQKLSPEMAQQELWGKFLNIGQGLVYNVFDRDRHVRREPFDPYRPLLLGCDFNVSHMCWVLVQRRYDYDAVIDEIYQEQPIPGTAPTETMAEEVVRRYAKRLKAPMYVYGDYYGNNRSSSTTRTDYDIVFDVLRRRMPVSVYDQVDPEENGENPAVVDRINTVQARLKNSLGAIRLFVDPRCRILTRDLERVSYKKNSVRREIDKKSDESLTHSSDALGYVLQTLYGERKHGGGSAVSPRRNQPELELYGD